MQETFKKYLRLEYILNFVVSLTLIKIIIMALFAVLNFNIELIASTIETNQANASKIVEKKIDSTSEKPAEKSKPAEPSQSEIHPEIIKILQAKNSYLNSKEEEFKEKSRDFELVQSEIESRMKALEELEKKLEQISEEIGLKKKEKQEALKKQHELDEKTRNERLQYLAGVYSAMEPGKAAELINLMDVNDAAKIFSLMKTKKVAPVMAQMNPEKASSIAKALTTIAGKNPAEDDNKTNE
jgi:flagellar motility protein MotE (MotC chaperone)